MQYIGFRSNGTQTANWRIDCPIRRPTQPHECQEYSTPANETRFMQTWNVRELNDNRRNGDDLQLNVYVRATQSASILLSSTEPVAMSTHNISAPYYEILLATGSDNREFELQRNTGRLDRTTEKNVLDANKWVLVEISLKSGTCILFCDDTFGFYNHFFLLLGGTIEIKVGGSKGAKLKKKDSHLIDVQFIGFRSTDSKLVSDWRFDC